MTNGYIVAIFVLSFLMSFSIGANDAANALATSYGSKAAPLMLLLILGAIFEFSDEIVKETARNVCINLAKGIRARGNE